MADRDDMTLDGFLNLSFFLYQPRRGAHRSGLDAILLAASIDPHPGCRVADLGAGTGAAGCAVAARCRQVDVVLVERDSMALSLVRQSLAAAENGAVLNRVSVVAWDLDGDDRDRQEAGLVDGTFDFVIANPPFNDGRHRASPHMPRAAAHVMASDTLERWVSHSRQLLRAGGELAFILRPQNLAEMLHALSPAFGNTRLVPIHPKPETAANRLIVVATKGRKSATALLPGLTLHQSDGQWQPQVDAILRGRRGLFS